MNDNQIDVCIDSMESTQFTYAFMHACIKLSCYFDRVEIPVAVPDARVMCEPKFVR